MAELSKKIGALWLKQGNKEKFMSGEITVGEQKIRVMVFKNGFKDADNKPDYVVHSIVEPKTE